LSRKKLDSRVLQVAKNMKQQSLGVEMIQQVTGLTPDDIKKL
jgi:predicted transposase YdaD